MVFSLSVYFWLFAVTWINLTIEFSQCREYAGPCVHITQMKFDS